MRSIAIRGALAVVLLVGLLACGERVVSVVGDDAAPALMTVKPMMIIQVGEEKDLLPYLRLTETGAVPFIPLIWEISNPALLSVDASTGRAKGLGAGLVVVQVKAARNQAEASQMMIEVVGEGSALVKEVQVLPSSHHMAVGDSVSLRAQVLMPDGQINGNVVWASSDNTIAVVNPTTGVVSALRPGRVTIVAGYALAPGFKGLADLTIHETTAQIPATPPAASLSVVPTETGFTPVDHPKGRTAEPGG